MKKLGFLLICASLCSIISDQTTYSDTDFANVLDSFHVSVANVGLNTFDFSQTGASYNWNYSALGVNQQKDNEWIAPVDGGYRNAWCAANGVLVGCIAQFDNYTNLAKYSLDSISLGGVALTNVVEHYNKTSSMVEFKMFGATINIGGIPISIPIEYTDPDILYNFPINYLDQDVSASSYELDLNPYGVPFKYAAHRTRTNEIEGWGVLSTPYGNYNNVLKVKTIITKSDTIYTDVSTIPVIDTLVEYKWLDPLYGIPVLQVDGNVVAGTEVITSATYLDSVQCVSPTALYVYNPLMINLDPSTNSVDVNFINLSANADSSHWDFADGITSIQNSPSHTYYCPGIYMVELVVVNQTCVPDSSATITLPVVVADTNNILTSYQSLSACNSTTINGSIYTSSQIVIDTLAGIGINGCDSIVVTNLSITAIDSLLTVTPDSLIAINGYDSYQWFACVDDLPVSGETNPVFIPADNEFYYVEITSGSCISSSMCQSTANSEINEVSVKMKISVYPNPTTNCSTISWKESTSGSYQLVDISGKELYSNEFNSIKKLICDLTDYESGTYFIILKNEGRRSTLRIIKK